MYKYKQKHKIYLKYTDQKLLSKFVLELQKYLNLYSTRLKELGIVPVSMTKDIDLSSDTNPLSRIIILDEYNTTPEAHIQILKDLTDFYKPLISIPTYEIDYKTGVLSEVTAHYFDPNTIKSYLYGDQDSVEVLKEYCEYLVSKYNTTEKQIDTLQNKVALLLQELCKIDKQLKDLPCLV
jgi:hypothetical protein